MSTDKRCSRHAAPGNLLLHDAVADFTEPSPAVFRGENRTQQAQFTQFLNQLRRNPFLLIDLFGDRLDFSLDKLTYHIPEHFLLGCQIKGYHIGALYHSEWKRRATAWYL